MFGGPLCYRMFNCWLQHQECILQNYSCLRGGFVTDGLEDNGNSNYT